ncbi:hypothetical protein H6F61_13815 [Cyanobacteria bacterium FACHB-472]|nr:hypothetical protein [Cyanobacteria bacterium FACHB-472]
MAPESVQAATLTTLTFDELPTQPVDDLSFKGVTFDLKVDGVDSTAATYNVSTIIDALPLFRVDYSSPALEIASPGILTLDFATPTPIVMFGIEFIRDFRDPRTPVFTVGLFDVELMSLESSEVTASETDNLLPSPLRGAFFDASFAYNGTQVKRVVVDFSKGNLALPIGFDNLTYQAATQTASVPEPGSVFGLLAFSALGAGSVIQRKHKQQIETYLIAGEQDS